LTTEFNLPPILQFAPVALVAVGLDGRILAINEWLERLAQPHLGEALVGKSVFDLIEPEDAAGARRDFAALVSGSRPAYSARRRYRTASGIHDVDVNVAAVYDSNERPEFAVAVVGDLAEQKAAAEAARHAAELEAIFQSLPAAIYIGDSTGIRLTNEIGLEQLGYASLEELNRPVSALSEQLQNRDANTGERIDWSDEPFVRAVHGDRVDREVISRHRRTGEEVIQRVIAAPVRINGRIAGAVAINTNITQSRQTECALRLSEAQYRSLVEQAPLSVQLVAPDGRTLQVNRAWERLWGLTLEQLCDYNMLEDPQLEERGILPHIRRALAGEAGVIPAAPYDPERTLPGRSTREDSKRWVRAVVYPLKDETGDVRQIVLIHEDISEQVHAEERRREAEAARERLLEEARRTQRELEVASRAKDEFLATLSHELRTPMNAVLGWTQILRGRAHDEETRRGLEVIHRNAVAQERLIDDLLDTSRIITGKLRLQITDVHLRDVILGALETVRPAAEAKGVLLAASFPDALPAMPGDAERLQQVFWNLLSNAVKFTSAGESVHVVVTSEPGAIEASIQDTGVGISADALPHIFDRFMQEDSSTTRAHRGLGLGLAIVRHLAELHGATVSAASDGAGRGATFRLRFPITGVRGTSSFDSLAKPSS
jgi:PAS domain S-box-containing protein